MPEFKEGKLGHRLLRWVYFWQNARFCPRPQEQNKNKFLVAASRLRDVAARVAELIHRFDEADLVLNDTLADTLTREELGFPAPAAEGQAADGDE